MSLNYWSAPALLQPVMKFEDIKKDKPMTDEEMFTHIQEIVSMFMGINMGAIHGKARNTPLVKARSFIFYFGKKFTVLSLKYMGNEIGGRDHSTVIHSQQQLNNFLDTEPEYRTTLKRIESKIV